MKKFLKQEKTFSCLIILIRLIVPKIFFMAQCTALCTDLCAALDEALYYVVLRTVLWHFVRPCVRF